MQLAAKRHRAGKPVAQRKAQPNTQCKESRFAPLCVGKTGLNLWRNREESTKSHLLPTGGVHPAAREEASAHAEVPVSRRREVDAVEQAEGEAGKSPEGVGGELTPAMEAGVTTSRWTVRQLVGMIEG